MSAKKTRLRYKKIRNGKMESLEWLKYAKMGFR
jgi:hypothetical protein